MRFAMRWMEERAVVLVAAALAACGGSTADAPADAGACDPAAQTGCAAGAACERVRGGAPACFAPVAIEGRVLDLMTGAGLAGARVAALDETGVAASSVAVTAADGAYALRVPAERNADGTPVAAVYTLRADALGYQSFPGGPRPALPLATATATATAGGGATIRGAATDVGLLPLPAGARGTVAGRVEGDGRAGVLVVAGAATAVTDRDGQFTVFNVAPGEATLRGYAAGVQLAPATVTVADGARVEAVVLRPTATPLATVSGSIELADAASVRATSVVLAVRSTYNAALERGEIPRGLRRADVASAFRFEAVPDGEYVVLAAFDNDGAVRDPDQHIGGTALVTVTVPAGASRAIDLGSGFKVTGALAVRGPGAEAPEAVTAARPTFTWQDDASENGYDVQVFDAFGNTVWRNESVPSARGGDTSIAYGGPDLVPGMYYQFRVTSWRMNPRGERTAISRTEELRGTFFAPRR